MRGLLLVGVLVALAVPSIAEAEGTQPVKDNDTDKNADVSAEIHTLENLVVKETGTSVETLIKANDDAAPAERGELDPLKRDKRTVLLALAKGILVGKALGFALGPRLFASDLIPIPFVHDTQLSLGNARIN